LKVDEAELLGRHYQVELGNEKLGNERCSTIHKKRRSRRWDRPFYWSTHGY